MRRLEDDLAEIYFDHFHGFILNSRDSPRVKPALSYHVGMSRKRPQRPQSLAEWMLFTPFFPASALTKTRHRVERRPVHATHVDTWHIATAQQRRPGIAAHGWGVGL